MDTAGQEIFRPLVPHFYKIASGIIIVFDKSSQESLNLVEHFYKEAKNHAKNNPIFILIGNKSDLEPVVSTDEGHEAALRLGALYIELSAKNNENIEYIFEMIAAQIINKFNIGD